MTINYHGIDHFELTGGVTLDVSVIQNLVAAMSSFDMQDVSDNTASSHSDYDGLQTVIAVNWS